MLRWDCSPVCSPLGGATSLTPSYSRPLESIQDSHKERLSTAHSWCGPPWWGFVWVFLGGEGNARSRNLELHHTTTSLVGIRIICDVAVNWSPHSLLQAVKSENKILPSAIKPGIIWLLRCVNKLKFVTRKTRFLSHGQSAVFSSLEAKSVFRVNLSVMTSSNI